MMNITFIKDYKNNDKYRLSFNKLANETFGINFEEWYQRGCWNDRYICYSFISNDEVVANLSISLMDIIIGGTIYSAIQIGTVMTEKNYRNKGLSRALMEIVLDEYKTKCNFIYLFANKSVLNFYPKFGFSQIKSPDFFKNINLNNQLSQAYTINKLNVLSDDKDWNLLMNAYSSRKVISDKCSVLNSEGILSWYCINIFANDIYLIEELGAIVIFQREENVIHIYDIITNKEFNLNQIIEIIANGANIAHLHFMPNDDNYSINYDTDPDDSLFVLPLDINKFDEIKLPKITQA